MTAVGIQGISSYQMQVQSLSSRVNELSKEGDNNSLSMASALKQQMNGIQSKLFGIQASNKYAQLNSYNSNAEIETNTTGNNFDVYF